MFWRRIGASEGGSGLRGGTSEAAGYWERLTGRYRAMGFNGPLVFVFFFFDLTSKFRKLYQMNEFLRKFDTIRFVVP